MKYTIYKTTNLINNKIYIGTHITDNPNDSYLGSGTVLKRAIEKHSKVNFNKEILFIYDNKEDMYNKEKELVDANFVKRKDTYNLKLGGEGGWNGMVVVKDTNGNILQVLNDDPRYLSGELVFIQKGRHHTNKTKQKISRAQQNKINVRDTNGNIIKVSVTDPRYLSGELVFIHKGLKRSDETKRKMSKSLKGKNKGRKLKPFTEEHLQKMSESRKNKKYVCNDELCQRKYILKNEVDLFLQINPDWRIGSKFKNKTNK